MDEKIKPIALRVADLREKAEKAIAESQLPACVLEQIFTVYTMRFEKQALLERLTAGEKWRKETSNEKTDG